MQLLWYFCQMLKVDNLSFAYDKIPILENLSFNLKEGDHLSIVGESGSGKSTLIKLLYGAYDLNEGQIFWKDQEILGPAYNLVIGYDFMKYVAQEFDLMPYTSVQENVGQYLSNFFLEEKASRVEELLAIVELSEFSKTKVKLLSGGQKQRVALARAIAKQPEIILLDEPFSHIDNFKKRSLRRRLFTYLKQQNITCIVATHEKEDVLGFADKMLIVSQKAAFDFDTPEKLYAKPSSELIASFFGEYSVINNEFYYAHQLCIVKESENEATVKTSYFQGSYYLIECEYKNITVYIKHDQHISLGSQIYFKMQ